jgi:BCD family chlorophyll transporter-like MFS transporter
LLGLIRLEVRTRQDAAPPSENYSWGVLTRAILENQQAKLFFIYLVILLAAILGQDILLEPFGGEAFGLTVQQTTRITSIWGSFFLVTLVVAGALEGRLKKRTMAILGGWGALLGFLMIITSAFLLSQSVFYTGVVFLGAGTGLATVANLSLMLDMTTADKVGLFIGAWGMANAFSRLIGSVLGGAVRDVVTRLSQDAVMGYAVVFAIEAAFLAISLLMLRRIDVGAFRQQVESQPSFVEQVAMAGEAG